MYKCPTCHNTYEYDIDLIGLRVKCPHCGHKYTVESRINSVPKHKTKIKVRESFKAPRRPVKKKKSRSYSAPTIFILIVMIAVSIYFSFPKNKQLTVKDTTSIKLNASHSKPINPHNLIQMPREKLEPFLKTYCIECHGPKKQKGQLRFDNISWNITNNDTAQIWQDILDQINSGDMPPEKADQPQKNELITALGSLTKGIQHARRALTDHGGVIKMRRLNKREFSNTIHHLFGFDVPLDEIPEDGEINHFDTIGDEQFFTSNHFEKYLKLNRQIVKEAFRHSIAHRQKTSIQRVEPEKRVIENVYKKSTTIAAQEKMFKQGKSWQEMGFADYGEFKFWKDSLPREKSWLQRTMSYPKFKSGMYLTTVRTNTSIARHTDIRAEYILRIRGGVVGNPLPMRRVALIQDSNGARATIGLRGTPEKPETVEVRLRQSMGRFAMNLIISENLPPSTWPNIGWGDDHLKRLQGSLSPYNSLWIDWLELEGPFYPDKKSFFENIMTQDGPAKNSKFMKDANANELIEKFAFEAYRRHTPNPAFLKGLQNHFQELRTQKYSYIDAMSEIFALILTSPSFLYLQEDKKNSRLNNRDLAIRIAYFLWSAPPDEELYQADLKDPKTLQTQVNRLLESSKSQAFYDGFIRQWAEFDRFHAITIDTKEQPHFNRGIRHSADREVREFFKTLIKENLPARNLIDSDFITINSALAAHYGIKGIAPKDDNFVKVKLPFASARGGLMTQAAFLMTGSNGERSSPVIRGALIMEKLLNDKPAPPPPNVPELSAASEKPQTNREMVKLHQSKAACASCHKKMDVIGFGLENFDTIGRWRDTELVGKKEVAIDPSGTLPSGHSFHNIQNLKKALLKYEPALAKELVESILAYGLGRTIEFSDADDVELILSKIKDDEYKMKDMVREIALSSLFTK